MAEYGGRIYDQIRRMGASPDWSQTAYTLDPALCAAVLEAFVQFHEAQLIYRHNRLVNWDCRLKTAVSEIEVRAALQLAILGSMVGRQLRLALLRPVPCQ